MKLNLLIFSLLGVSVSASGIRGFTPIKGNERRLASSTKNTEKSGKDTTVELSSTGRVIKCDGNECEEFIKHCTDVDDYNVKFVRNFSGSTSSDSGSGNSRRLKKTSSSSDDDGTDFRVKNVEDCVLTERASGGGSSSSSSSSDDTRAAKKKRTTTETTTETTEATPTETTAKSKKVDAGRVLHSSWKNWKKWSGRRRRRSRGNTRIVLNHGGDLVRCSGTSCTRFYDHCIDGDRHVRNFVWRVGGSTTTSGKSRKLKKSSSSSSSSGDNIRLVTYDVVDPDECAYVEHRTYVNSWPTYYPRYYGRKWKSGWSGWRAHHGGSSSSKSRKLRRVLHSSSSSSSKKDKKADTRIEFTSGGGLVSCSGKNCKKFIKRCTDGKKHLKTFDFLKYLDGSTTKSSGKSRRLKKSSSGNKDNIYIRFINMDDVDVDADGCFLA